ncbi:MAG: VWA domain-containing protein [Opitutae bacterium]|nr:VWA domain-containing protein [Opitutae bacterium]
MKVLNILLVSLSISLCARAAPMPEAVFILDASGSMAEAAGPQTKMAAAKAVLAQVVPAVAPEVKVGLAAYGHRRDRDCDDIEILVPPGSEDRAAVLARIAAMQPKGVTPIAAAVAQVAEFLKGRAAETMIVLVSDGKETCGGDPRAVVKALKDAGVKFVMHVVGFGVAEADRAELAGIAEAGGGTYFSAGDAAALLAALQAVSEEIAQKVAAAKTVVVAQATGLGKLRIALPESALKSLSGFRVVRKISDKVVKEGELPAADSTHPLMSGDYALTLLFANPNYQPPTEMPLGDFTVAKGATTEVALGALVFNIAEELQEAPVEAIILSAAGGRETLRILPHGNDYYLFKPKALLPGTYDVAFRYRRCETPSTVASGLAVSAGQETALTLDSGIGVARPRETRVRGWDLLPAGGGAPVLSIRRGEDNEEPLWRPFPVRPGTYDLQVWVGGMDEALPAGEGLEIGEGQTVRFETGL